MTDDVYTLGENLPCTSPVGQQSGSFENLRAVLHWDVGALILVAYLDAPHPCHVHHGITRTCPYLTINMQHPYLSSGQRSSCWSRFPRGCANSELGSVLCSWCCASGPIWGCYRPHLGSLIFSYAKLVLESYIKRTFHINWSISRWFPIWGTLPTSFTFILLLAIYHLEVPGYIRLRYVVRRGYFHSAFVPEFWIWNYPGTRLCLCSADDLYYLGFETVRLDASCHSVA